MNARTLRRAAATGVLAVAAATSSLAITGTAQAAGAPTRTTISTSTPTVVPGQVVKLKAVVTYVTGTALPAGSVSFKEGATVLGTATLAEAGGVMTARFNVPSMAFGQHSVVATYSGSGAAAASTSLTLVITVNKNGSTTTIANVATATPGRWKLNARVKIALPGKGVPTGLVTYVVDGGAPQIVALSSAGKAPLTVTFVVGTSHTVVASYGGATGIGPSTATLTFTA
jgi:large repetitive protein